MVIQALDLRMLHGPLLPIQWFEDTIHITSLRIKAPCLQMDADKTQQLDETLKVPDTFFMQVARHTRPEGHFFKVWTTFCPEAVAPYS